MYLLPLFILGPIAFIMACVAGSRLYDGKRSGVVYTILGLFLAVLSVVLSFAISQVMIYS